MLSNAVESADAENTASDGPKTDITKRGNGRTADEIAAGIDVSAGQGRADAGDSLGSPASVSETDAVSELSAAPVAYPNLDVPGADPGDDVEPFEVVSLPEQIDAARAFFAEQKDSETPEQVKRARAKSRVFSLMQYHQHPETDEVMYTQDQLEAGVDRLADGRDVWYAYIAHPNDRIVQVDEGTYDVVCCGLKGLHWHLVLWFKGDDRPTLRTVSDTLETPSARVRLPKEVAAQDGGDDYKGRGAAEKAFYDLCEYLPHESRGKNAIRGINQPERFYLVDTTQPGNPGKYQYGRGRIRANFDFGAELDRHMAGRASAADGSRSIVHRKRALRRLVMEGISLDEVELKDPDAFADDLPRLQALAAHWEAKPENRPRSDAGLGVDWHKSVLAICGAKGVGKGVLADEVAQQAKQLVAMAGINWPYVQPPGRNALEGVAGAMIVHHDDARFDMVPSYDEGLRWLDPHRATESWKRHARTEETYAPRVIMMSSTETPQSLGLSMKTRKASDVLAFNTRGAKTTRFPTYDIDEFLRRIGWVVEVSIPRSVTLTGDDHHDFPVIRSEMLVSIHQVNVNSDRRVDQVMSRSGEFLGQITTTHQMIPVAVVKGAPDAARFLAVSLLMKNNRDIVDQIPESEFASFLAQKAAVEVAAAEEHERQLRVQKAAAEDAARREREAAEDRERHEQERREAQLRELRLCTCAPAQSGEYARHEDSCAALSEEERRSRADARREALDAKATRLRENGWLLKSGGAA